MAYPHESKYKKEDRWGELRNCDDPPDFKGSKSSNREQEFCRPLTCLDTVDIKKKTTLNETEVIPPAITVGGLTFVPTEVELCIGISGGGGTVGPDGGSIAPPTPVMGSFILLVAEDGTIAGG